jgi:lipoprotein signal peptidase
MKRKYLQFGVLVLLCVLLDQWSKSVATDRLATTRAAIDHPMILVVSDQDAGKTTEEFLGGQLSRNNADEVREISRRYTKTKEGKRLTPSSKLTAGQEVRILRRKVVVVPGYFEFEYTRNPGAAFGLLADSESPMRIPFFVAVSLVAIGVILLMLRGLDEREQLSIWALSLIAGGAVGNFIDRVSYGWVTDFIVWKYTDEFRWPTFNIADAFISVGVALLVLEMILDAARSRSADAESEA